MELILHEPIKKSTMMALFFIRSCSYRSIGIWCSLTLLVKIGRGSGTWQGRRHSIRVFEYEYTRTMLCTRRLTRLAFQARRRCPVQPCHALAPARMIEMVHLSCCPYQPPFRRSALPCRTTSTRGRAWRTRRNNSWRGRPGTRGSLSCTPRARAAKRCASGASPEIPAGD